MKWIVKHEETNMFLLNVHSLHNYDMIAKVIPLDLHPALTVPLVTAGDSEQVRLKAANHIHQKKAGETTTMVVPRLEQHADSKQGLICKTIYSAQTTTRVRSGEFGLSTLSCRPSNIINYLSLEDLKLPRRTTEQNAPPSLLCLSLRKKEVFSSGYCIYPSCQSPPTPRSHLSRLLEPWQPMLFDFFPESSRLAVGRIPHRSSVSSTIPVMTKHTQLVQKGSSSKRRGRFKPLVLTETLAVANTPCNSRSITSDDHPVDEIACIFSGVFSLEAVLLPTPSFVNITLPPKLSDIKQVQRWAIILCAIPDEDSQTCALVSRAFRYAGRIVLVLGRLMVKPLTMFP
ncbi:hypothetical protein K503DRAFT_805510 [Rhizopogon vinicolor AM-OR11-026]|uniref:Uncharacterized protein n=1 Tax=Rhizopogon vinicolor AM-OR11-026 TaxID=1314800 RepID=A0A1B7MHL6_9AGAM|nr:hypothetical protein K503DRAFT_805510 [Rhizopogon vinicolor AM-OR11-026]